MSIPIYEFVPKKNYTLLKIDGEHVATLEGVNSKVVQMFKNVMEHLTNAFENDRALTFHVVREILLIREVTVEGKVYDCACFATNDRKEAEKMKNIYYAIEHKYKAALARRKRKNKNKE